jgi:hypothetical protein
LLKNVVKIFESKVEKFPKPADRKLELVPALGNSQIVVGALLHVGGIHRALYVDVEVAAPVRVECAKNEQLLDQSVQLVEAPLAGLDTQPSLTVLEQRANYNPLVRYNTCV